MPLVSSITVNIYGSGTITTLGVGATNIFSSESGNITKTISGNDLTVGTYHDAVNGDVFSVHVDVLSGMFGGDRYDLEKIELIYEYPGADATTLEYFHTAYSAFNSISNFKSEVVDGTWGLDSAPTDELIVEGVRKTVAFCQNLKGIDGDIYGATKSFSDSIDSFKDLVDLIDLSVDFLLFWGDPGVYEQLGGIKASCDQAATACANLAKEYQNLAFDGYSGDDASLILTKIQDAKTKLNTLKGQLQTMATFYMHNDGGEAAKAGKESMGPMMRYQENSTTLLNSFLPKLISDLDNQSAYVLTKVPVVTDKYTYASTTFGEDYDSNSKQIINPRSSFTYPDDFDKICMAIRLEDVYENGDYSPLIRAKCEYYRPDGSYDFHVWWDFDAPSSGYWSSSTGYDDSVHTYGLEEYPGRWTCKIYVDGEGGGSAYSQVDTKYINIIRNLPSKATSPNPPSSSTNQSINTDISWSNGGGATSYDVYFGTDSSPDSGELKGNQTSNSFDTGTLNNGITYYWRIDAKNSAGTTKGDLWHFKTQPLLMTVQVLPYGYDESTRYIRTWSGEPAKVLVLVTNANSPVTIEWSCNYDTYDPSYTWTVQADPVEEHVFYISMNKPAPNGAATYPPPRFTATVTDDTGGTKSDSESLALYDDACQMTRAANRYSLDPSDFNRDCVTDILDLAIIAVAWLEEFIPTEPFSN